MIHTQLYSPASLPVLKPVMNQFGSTQLLGHTRTCICADCCFWRLRPDVPSCRSVGSQVPTARVSIMDSWSTRELGMLPRFDYFIVASSHQQVPVQPRYLASSMGNRLVPLPAALLYSKAGRPRRDHMQHRLHSPGLRETCVPFIGRMASHHHVPDVENGTAAMRPDKAGALPLGKAQPLSTHGQRAGDQPAPCRIVAGLLHRPWPPKGVVTICKCERRCQYCGSELTHAAALRKVRIHGSHIPILPIHQIGNWPGEVCSMYSTSHPFTFGFHNRILSPQKRGHIYHFTSWSSVLLLFSLPNIARISLDNFDQGIY